MHRQAKKGSGSRRSPLGMDVSAPDQNSPFSIHSLTLLESMVVSSV